MNRYANFASIVVLLFVATACTTIPKVTIPDSDEHSPPDIFELRLNDQLIPDIRSTDSAYILRDVSPRKQHLLLAKVQDNESGVSKVAIVVQIRCPDGNSYWSKDEFVTRSDISTAGPGDAVYVYLLGALHFRLQDVVRVCGDLPGDREYWFARIYVLATNYFNRESHREYWVEFYPVR